MIFEEDKYYRLDVPFELWVASSADDMIVIQAGALVRCVRIEARRRPARGRFAVCRARLDFLVVEVLIRVSETCHGPSGITPITSPLHLLADHEEAGLL